MTVILDFCNTTIIGVLLRAGFNARGINDAQETEIIIEPANAIELQRLGQLLEQYE